MEFALILPLLVVLTIGSIYLTMSYIQKSRLNAIAFMSARSAAVYNENLKMTTFVKDKYQAKTEQNWVDKVQIEQPTGDDETPEGRRHVTVRLVKPGERLDILANAIDILSGGGQYNPQDTVSQMRLSKEYFYRKGEFRPRTFSVVNYRYEMAGGLDWLTLLDKLPKKIFNMSQMEDTRSKDPNKPGSSPDEYVGTKPPMANIEAFYDARNWEKAWRENLEKEDGTFLNMQRMADNFKAIELGGALAGYLTDFLTFAGPLKDLLADGAVEAVHVVEITLNQVSTAVDKHNRLTFSDL